MEGAGRGVKKGEVEAQEVENLGGKGTLRGKAVVDDEDTAAAFAREFGGGGAGSAESVLAVQEG